MTYSIPVKPGRRSRPATAIEVSILEVLKGVELSTGQVAEKINRHPSRASTVLHRLAAAGFVKSRRAFDQHREGVTWTMWRLV